jgi:phage terminase Nu1 subunit (DNA packaging protein)
MDLDGSKSPMKRSRAEMEAEDARPAVEAAVNVEDGIVRLHLARAQSL